MATFRGYKACSCLKKWLTAYEAELLRVGEIKYSLDVYQLIGGYSKSGGTHLPGGAFDLGQYSKRALLIARQMGAATWHRTPAQGFIHHSHGVLKGCPHNRGGRYQITSLEKGGNGLANGGRDDGPRAGVRLPLRTWEQGIAWAKAQAKAAKPKMRTTDFAVYAQNCASDQDDWPARAKIIASRVLTFAPHFAAYTELFTDRRLTLTRLMVTKYGTGGVNHGKVIGVRRSVNGWKPSSGAKKYSLGNGKHAVAKSYRHRSTGAEYVLAVLHLSWQHDKGSLRAAEAKRLVAYLDRDFKGKPRLIVGDTNDAAKATKSRPKDSSGAVFKAAGMHDVAFDVPASKRGNDEYNSAHNNKTPATTDGVHIDRAWASSQIQGIGWALDVIPGKRPADHWGLRLKLRITHPIKKK